jgi:hypothetical protein
MHATCGSLPPCLVTQRCGTPNPEQAGTRCQIKGNISLKGGRLDHVPGDEFYGRRQISVRKEERWFCTEQQARVAGWRRSRR